MLPSKAKNKDTHNTEAKYLEDRSTVTKATAQDSSD